MAHDLNLPTISDGQADDQWQASNDADAALGNAMQDTKTVDFSGGNVTLTSAEFRSAMTFIPSGLSTNRDLTVPAVKRAQFIVHNTDAADTISVKRGATTIAVAPGQMAFLYTDGTTDGLYGTVLSAGSGGGVTDGDKGDVTVSSSGTVWRVDALASPTAGNILYADNNSPGSWQKLAPGTSGQVLKTNGAAAPSWSHQIYDIPLSFAGTPTAGQLMGKYVAVRDVEFAANFTGSAGHVGTNPAATFDIDVKGAGSTIGTISISTGGTFTFTTVSGTAKTLSNGTRLEFYAPANSPAEATVANIAATLKGTAI